MPCCHWHSAPSLDVRQIGNRDGDLQRGVRVILVVLRVTHILDVLLHPGVSILVVALPPQQLPDHSLLFSDGLKLRLMKWILQFFASDISKKG